MDELVYVCGGDLVVTFAERENLELPKTKRCTPFDYTIKVGCEYETGVGCADIQTTAGCNPDSKGGIVYGYCQDGGGVELKTVVMENPNIFAYIGKFDAMCKSVRKTPGYKPKASASTHMHISINASPKIAVPKGKKQQEVNPTWYGTAMFRRTLIANNWYAMFNKYTLALSFFDAFNPTGRRPTRYGKGFRLKKNLDNTYKLQFSDKRFLSLVGKDYKALRTATGRDSLLRTNTDNSDKSNIHWEF